MQLRGINIPLTGRYPYVLFGNRGALLRCRPLRTQCAAFAALGISLSKGTLLRYPETLRNGFYRQLSSGFKVELPNCVVRIGTYSDFEPAIFSRTGQESHTLQKKKESSMAQQPSRYCKQFKIDAVSLSLKCNKTTKAIADDLGISANVLCCGIGGRGIGGRGIGGRGIGGRGIGGRK
jgi:hypothetical protein